MTWDISPLFRCGHRKAGNVERFIAKGRTYERCRECHIQANTRWNARHKAAMERAEEKAGA